MRGTRQLGFGLLVLVLIVLVIGFIIADHVVTTSSGGTSFSVDENVSSFYNISVNNSDSGQDANITQVNITIPSSFSFISGSSGSNAYANFSNTGSVLSWTNSSYFVVNGSAVRNFWFNAIAPASGTYNLTVVTLNASGNYSSNLTVVVSDTFEFNGTIYDPDGNVLNNTLINVTVRNDQYQVIGYNSTNSNASGWFNLTVNGNNSWMYQPVVQHFNASTGVIKYVGQSLPAFGYSELASGLSVNFYLKNAGTINITAVNQTGSEVAFNYQVKDQDLGYPIEESFSSYVTNAIAYVPRDRNYSVMIYPNESMPVSYDWNNFTASSSYNIGDLSSYNVTTHTLHKQFNTSESFAWISGNFLNLTGGAMAFDEIIIIPFILEPGNMIYLGENAGIPYNMSSWRGGSDSDTYNITAGTYNITVPGTAESSTFMLFAVGRNGTNYYGSYKNASISYGVTTAVFNFTMYPLMSTDWASATGNISMNDVYDWSQINVSAAKQGFNLVNASSNLTLSQLPSTHIEVTVDYTNYGASEITFMDDISPGSAGNFYLPLLNVTGIKEINVYCTDFAPRRIGEKTAAEILANPNISMAKFNPGDIEGDDIASNLYVSLYKSNSTCDVPVPPSGCSIANSTNMDNFNPFNAIIGGGDISFRMGLTSSGIEVHYVKVDLLASGPPDALFDDSPTTSTSGSFSSALRFGSNGPTIYDCVMVSIPYTQGTTSVVGLNESETVNMSIPIFYDGDWDVIWNTSIHGTNASQLAENYSHYSEHSSEWDTLIDGDDCVTSVASFNAANPCYIDIENNRIWIRLPHFSGTQPAVNGGVTNTSSGGNGNDTNDDGSGGDTPAASTLFWTATYVVDEAKFRAGYTKELAAQKRLRINISGSYHYVGVVQVSTTTVKINVSSTPQQAVLFVGDTRSFDIDADDYYDLNVTLNSIQNNTANLTILSVSEKVPGSNVSENASQTSVNASTTSGGDEAAAEDKGKTGKGLGLLLWIFIGLIIAVFILMVVYFIVMYVMKKKMGGQQKAKDRKSAKSVSLSIVKKEASQKTKK